ncbi:MAG TPA: STAS domain-containing protein [Nocardioides sp.]|nr:STAS domain-containing protein [Nocardioides sp.]
MEERPLTFTVDSDTRTLYVSGEVDELSAVRLREALETNSNGFADDLVVDLSDVDFLPSMGVGVLAVASRTADERGSKIELVAVKGTIAQQVLNICGLPHRVA